MLAEHKEKLQFLSLIGRLLHEYGTNALRWEAALSSLVKSFGLKGDFSSAPTNLILSLEINDETFVRQIRVNPGEVNIHKLNEVDEIATKVFNKTMTIQDGIKALKMIDTSSNLHNDLILALAFCMTSSSLSIILGGSLNDFFVSFFNGMILGGCFLFIKKYSRFSDVFEIAVSILSTLSLFILSTTSIVFNFQITLIASLIVIIPGLSITVAMSELATKNLASGTARLMGALVDLFKISFGVLVGYKIGINFISPVHDYYTLTLPIWTTIPAIIFAAISFNIIFQARYRDFIWILVSVTLALGGAKFYSFFFDPIFTVFLSAFSIRIYSNLFANIKDRPSMTVLLPGIICLVPGSVGFKGLNLLMQEDLLMGLTGSIQMFVLAITIVAGLLFANIILPPRRTI